MHVRQVSAALAGLVVVGAFGAASAQDGAGAANTNTKKTKLVALPMGQAAPGTTKSEGATYGFKAESAGVLTVALRGEGESDLVLLVTDEDGQTVQNGRSDQDLGGARGAEQLAVTIPYPGDYIVRVDMSGGDTAKFSIGASWLVLPQAARQPDPDGRPRSANPLEVGKAVTDTVDASAGDMWDWFAVQIQAPGTLTVLTKAPEGDLVLEAFHDGNFREPAERSDQDMQEVKGNESISMHVEAGQTIFFRVSSLFSGGPISYKITSGLIPD
jgi:hypothetical protein